MELVKQGRFNTVRKGGLSPFLLVVSFGLVAKVLAAEQHQSLVSIDSATSEVLPRSSSTSSECGPLGPPRHQQERSRSYSHQRAASGTSVAPPSGSSSRTVSPTPPRTTGVFSSPPSTYGAPSPKEVHPFYINSSQAGSSCSFVLEGICSPPGVPPGSPAPSGGAARRAAGFGAGMDDGAEEDEDIEEFYLQDGGGNLSFALMEEGVGEGQVPPRVIGDDQVRADGGAAGSTELRRGPEGGRRRASSEGDSLCSSGLEHHTRTDHHVVVGTSVVVDDNLASTAQRSPPAASAVRRAASTAPPTYITPTNIVELERQMRGLLEGEGAVRTSGATAAAASSTTAPRGSHPPLKKLQGRQLPESPVLPSPAGPEVSALQNSQVVLDLQTQLQNIVDSRMNSRSKPDAGGSRSHTRQPSTTGETLDGPPPAAEDGPERDGSGGAAYEVPAEVPPEGLASSFLPFLAGETDALQQRVGCSTFFFP